MSDDPREQHEAALAGADVVAGNEFKGSPSFEAWWNKFYGGPGDYPFDAEEFWVRKAFAWWGWSAGVEKQRTR